MKRVCKCLGCGHCKSHHRKVGAGLWGWCMKRECRCEVFI